MSVECRVGERTGSRCLECWVTKNERVVKIKGKVYTTVVRPALMYGAETSALEKSQE